MRSTLATSSSTVQHESQRDRVQDDVAQRGRLREVLAANKRQKGHLGQAGKTKKHRGHAPQTRPNAFDLNGSLIIYSLELIVSRQRWKV